MIKILFFGRLRDTISSDSIILEEVAGLDSVEKIRMYLSESRGSIWEEALNQSNIVISVNQVVVSTDAVVCDGDEVAFFPPMTGG